MKTTQIIKLGDAANLEGFEDDTFDLTFGSPPYEDAREYGIGFNLKGDAWVDWAFQCYMEHLRVTKGLVAWVVEGKTRQGQYSATPIKLMARLADAGVILRKPPIFYRNGVSGGGGRASQHADEGGSADWLKNNYEFIVCDTKSKGKLPWADTLWQKTPPKYGPGGAPSHRLKNGERVGCQSTDRRPNGELKKRQYKPPTYANPGNVLRYHVGKGHMGHDLAHENEAPFPLGLAEFFVRAFCKPGGFVLDPYSGSGTTMQACKIAGRNGVGLDIRESQVKLGNERLNGD